ncbi:MAG: acetyl-CoA carboxylase biotin carboxyl carrier protein [Flavobacteriales bacterium]|nr:acetyl-CoA carboxylase biotin carboxyl carrier protein [Flavobacteriales bacterium]MBL4734144.1 acetyl-CoA carboxylase biotin carboxyl carrier protein [Flavobacteriales bacterium]
MKLSEIQELIRFVAKSGVTEIELELKEFKITIKTPARKRRGGLVDSSEMIAETSAAAQSVIPQQVVVTSAPVAVPAPVPASGNDALAAENNTVEGGDLDESKYVTIKSPMIGTFYRAPSPDKPPFFNVGDDFNEGDIICIVEAMKLFNEIEAEVSGKIVKVLVDDASPVEYDQPIFLVEPH